MTAPLLLGAIVMPVLLLWAWFLIRALLGIVAAARAASGHPFPWPGATLPALRRWLSDPARAPERRRLAALTALLVALQIVMLLLVI